MTVRRTTAIIGLLSISILFTIACAPERDLPPPGGTAGAGDPAAGGGAMTGLPCDVSQVLAKDCLACHSATPKYGAPMALASLADLQKPAPSDPSKTVAQVSLARMQDTSRPMPPGAPAAAADVNAIAAWVGAGAPAGSCDAGGTPGTGDPGTTDPGTGTPGTGAPPPTASGMPCDVSKVLTERCTTCHASTPTAGAPMPLVTQADLKAPAKSNPSLTAAQVSVTRMKAGTMPPGGGLSAAEVATLENWVNAGAPAGSCDVTPPPPADPLPDNGKVCTSQSFWRGGNDGSSQMNPGLACIACHSRGEGPRFSAGGTVFPSAHEPDTCNGENGVTVQITDATGKVVTAKTNSAGNFYTSSTLKYPIRAKVISGSKVREMLTPQNSGDCNSCHTQAGTGGAPGRVVAP